MTRKYGRILNNRTHWFLYSVRERPEVERVGIILPTELLDIQRRSRFSIIKRIKILYRSTLHWEEVWLYNVSVSTLKRFLPVKDLQFCHVQPLIS